MKTNTIAMPVSPASVNYMQVFTQKFVAFVKWISVP